MYNLSICAIVRDEIDLKEWVSFHLICGVQHFYIYDNQSKIPIKETLKKEIEAGIVDCIYWPGDGGVQMPAYSHCINKFRNENNWIIVIDADEYIYAHTQDNLLDVLKNYEKPNVGGLVVNWRLVGSNGFITRPDGLVIENYTKMMPKDHIENLHIKSIVRAQYVNCAAGDPHTFLYKPGYFAVNENYDVVNGPRTNKHSSDKIIINHYVLKSLDQYKLNKLSRPRADTTKYPGKTLSDFFKFDQDCTDVNTDILKFVPRVKEELERWK